MTVITEAYIPACPATIEITIPPSNTLANAPRKVKPLHVAIYAFHPLVIIIGFVPVILLGWLGFIFLQYPTTFGQFVYFSYVVLPFVVQVCTAIFRARRVFWYLKYGTHGIAKIRMEVIDAITQTKVIDLGVRALQYVPSESDEPIVFYDFARPTRYLSLVPYKRTFFVRFDAIRMRFTPQVVISVLTAFVLLVEFCIVLSAPIWSGIRMVPSS